MRTGAIKDLNIRYLLFRRKINIYSARELKKNPMEHEGDGDINCNRCTRNNSQMFGKRNRRLRNQKTRRNHLDYSIIEIGQNTEKSPGDLRRLVVTETPVRSHQQMLV